MCGSPAPDHLHFGGELINISVRFLTLFQVAAATPVAPFLDDLLRGRRRWISPAGMRHDRPLMLTLTDNVTFSIKGPGPGTARSAWQRGHARPAGLRSAWTSE